jgi:hypothetical protein
MVPSSTWCKEKYSVQNSIGKKWGMKFKGKYYPPPLAPPPSGQRKRETGRGTHQPSSRAITGETTPTPTPLHPALTNASPSCPLCLSVSLGLLGFDRIPVALPLRHSALSPLPGIRPLRGCVSRQVAVRHSRHEHRG